MPQRVIHHTLTLTGSAQALPDIAGTGFIRRLEVSVDPSNVNPVYIGGSSGVTSLDYGTRLPAPVGGVPVAPWINEWLDPSALKMSDYFVLGTNSEKLHLLAVLYV